MKKSAELQDKMKTIQFKYKNDQEKMNQEMMELYKSENMSPFSGCLVGILQFVLLISIFSKSFKGIALIVFKFGVIFSPVTPSPRVTPSVNKPLS